MLNFEPVEVLDVLTDVNDSNATAVSGRYVVSQQNSPIEQTFLFYPLDPNNLQIPVRGEVVLGTEFLGKYYYMSKLNIQNSPIANTKPNISSYASKPVEDFQLGKYFTENPNGSKKLITREGDTILQGRFGNSIRLGSNQSEDFFNDPRTFDFIDSPNVKIVSGISDIGNDENVYYQENLNTEINSIYLTTKERVSFNYNNEEIDNVDEPQITIQSDNIVFHGRKQFNVYADKVVLGGNDNQPVPLGSNLSDLLKDTISLLRDVITSYASANPGSSAGLTVTATALENYFKEENEKFILSKKVNTE